VKLGTGGALTEEARGVVGGEGGVDIGRLMDGGGGGGGIALRSSSSLVMGFSSFGMGGRGSSSGVSATSLVLSSSSVRLAGALLPLPPTVWSEGYRSHSGRKDQEESGCL
jgi:hypothetical protein